MRLVLIVMLSGLMIGCTVSRPESLKSIGEVEILYTQYAEPSGINLVLKHKPPQKIVEAIKGIDVSKLHFAGSEPEGVSISGWEANAITVVWFEGRRPRAANIVASGLLILDDGSIFLGVGHLYQLIIDQLSIANVLDRRLPKPVFAPPPE